MSADATGRPDDRGPDDRRPDDRGPDDRAPAGLRPVELAAWLADRGLHLDPDAPAHLLAGGRSNVSYRLTGSRGERWVLRRPPLGHVLPTAHDMVREYRVLAGLHAAGFPVPRPIVACSEVDVIGAPFVLMEFVDGRVVDSPASARALAAPDADTACRSLIDTLATLHAIDPAAAGLADLGRPDGYLRRQVDRWAKQWDLTRTRDVDAVDALRDGVRSAVADAPPTTDHGIVHGDYRFDNVLLARDRPEVVAVLDWEMSTLGDPTIDLAILLVYWTQAGDQLRSRIAIGQNITDAPGFWTKGAIVARYAEVSGRALDRLDVCTALACFKLAVIMESIRFRALAGQQLGAGADEATSMGSATVALAELGLAVLADGAITGLSR